MSAGLLHDWANILVLTVITALSVFGLLSGEDSAVHSVVISLTLAYLISDALWIALQPAMVKTPRSIIAHHVVTIIVMIDTLEFASHRVNASRALLVEVNTVLLTLRRLLGRPVWCELGFYSTWVLIRLVWFPLLSISLVASTFGWSCKAFPEPLATLLIEVKPPAVRAYASLSFAAVVLLQFYWTLAMGRGFCKAKDKKREPAEGEPAIPAEMRYPALAASSTICITAALLYWMSQGVEAEL